LTLRYRHFVKKTRRKYVTVGKQEKYWEVLIQKKPLTKKEKNILKGKLVRSRERSYNSIEYCQTPNCSSKEFQKCHLIPEANQLKSIEENGKVSWINPKPASMIFKNFEIKWRREDIASILTFKGFCNPCDNNIFKLIDQPLNLIKKEMPLLAYRAFSYHYWIGRFEADSAERCYKILGENLNNVPPARIDDPRVAKSRAEEIQYEIQSDYLIRDSLIEEIKGNQSKLKSEIFILKEKSDFLYSCAVPLTLDIFMNPVEINWSTCWEPPKLFFHLLNYQNTSALILTWDEKFEKFVRNFIGMIKVLDPIELKVILFSYFSFNNMGLAVRTSFLESIPFDLKKKIRNEIKSYNKVHKIKRWYNKKIMEFDIGEMEISDELRV